MFGFFCDCFGRSRTTVYHLLISFSLMCIPIVVTYFLLENKESFSNHTVILPLCQVISPVIFLIGFLLLLQTVLNYKPPGSHLLDNMIISSSDVNIGLQPLRQRESLSIDPKVKAELYNLIGLKDTAELGEIV